MFSSADLSYYIVSLGCAKNLVDSERINGSMQDAGYRPSDTPEDSDILIINTCGFIKQAKEESIDVIFEALERGSASVHNKIPASRVRGREFCRKTVVVGCLSQRYLSEVSSEIPEVDFLYGIPDNRFVERMSDRFHVAIRPSPTFSRKPLVPGLTYAYVKISEGCSNNCSYCAIPLIRGPQRSYPRAFVLDEARQAAAAGARELIVVAQDITAYRWGAIGLDDIVRDMSEIEGIEWIRLMYCHPDHIDDRILDILGGVNKVVHYIDIPFQHASRRLLRSMGRAGDGDSYRKLLLRLRERVPDIRIRSTFMVGYPDETEEDFRELVDFLNDARLDRVGTFLYSPEEGTGAYARGDTVPEEVKRERHDRLMSLQRDISAEKLRAMIGSVVRVLVDERVDEATWIARTEYDAPEVDGIFYLTGKNCRANSMVSARVRDALEYDLIGDAIVS